MATVRFQIVFTTLKSDRLIKCFFPTLTEFTLSANIHLRNVSGDMFNKAAASFRVRASVRTALCNSCLSYKFLLTGFSDFYDSNVTAHYILFLWLLWPEIVTYRIIAYQFPAPITGRSPENLFSTLIRPKKLATKGKRRSKKAKENP